MPSLKDGQKSSHDAAARARAWRMERFLRVALGSMPLFLRFPLHGGLRILPTRLRMSRMPWISHPACIEAHPSPLLPEEARGALSFSLNCRQLLDRKQHPAPAGNDRIAKSQPEQSKFVNTCRTGHWSAVALLCTMLLLVVSACQSIQVTAEPAVATPQQTDAHLTEVAVDQSASAQSANAQPTEAPGVEPPASPLETPPPLVAGLANSTSVPPTEAEAMVAALVAQEVTPVRLLIADARMDVFVQPLGWETVRVDGERTTRWTLPHGAAGWHVDSARPGESGNMVISGRQLGGDVFAPIAQDALQVGQEIVLQDSAGNQYSYRIQTISAPLLIQGDAAAETQTAAYLAQTDSPTLTLVTGWPDFTTTHYIFVVATLQ